jgi:hypothetical protein
MVKVRRELHEFPRSSGGCPIVNVGSTDAEKMLIRKAGMNEAKKGVVNNKDAKQPRGAI